MSNAEFPQRTADNLTLPNGETVWVATLNTLLKDQAEAKSRRYASSECRGLLKGGADYAALLGQIRAMEATKQAEYLAQQQFWEIRQEAEGKYPDPQEPQQDGGTPEEYATAVAAWEDACKKAAEKRKKFEQTRYEAEVKKNAALTVKVREERCCTAYFAEEFAGYFVKRMTVETLLRAVRRADDHTQRYFACVEAVEDADDAVLAALSEFYFQKLDTVKSEEIPTSPAAS